MKNQKVKSILVGILMGIFITAVAFYFYNKQENEHLLIEECTKIENKTRTSSEELFEKKQECALYRKEIQTNLDEMFSIIVRPFLDEIFYSPSKNSCLYSYKEQWINIGKELDYTIYYIIDHLTNETVVMINSNLSDTACEYWEDMKEELKQKK